MAIAILAFGMGAILQLYVQTQKTANFNHRRTAAEFLVSRKAQQFKAAGYESLIDYIKESGQTGAPHKVLVPEKPAKAPLAAEDIRGGLAECLWQAELEQPNGSFDSVAIRVWAKWPDQGEIDEGAPMRETSVKVLVLE